MITPCSDPTKCRAVTEARFCEYDRNRDELALLAQEGGQAPGGGTFTTIGNPCAINDRGTVVFYGQGSEPGVSSFNDLFIKRSSSSPVERLYVSGPGTDLYLPVSVQLTDSDASPVLFSAYYPSPSAPPYGGLFGLTEEGLNTLATDGQTVDNIEINLRFMSGFLGQYTEHFDPPATVLLNDGLVIFTDHLNNTFATSMQNELLVFLSGESQPVVIEGRSYVPLLHGPACRSYQ